MPDNQNPEGDKTIEQRLRELRSEYEEEKVLKEQKKNYSPVLANGCLMNAVCHLSGGNILNPEEIKEAEKSLRTAMGMVPSCHEVYRAAEALLKDLQSYMKDPTLGSMITDNLYVTGKYNPGTVPLHKLSEFMKKPFGKKDE